MTLSFSTKFPSGDPTYFIEKINDGIISMDKGFKHEVWEKEREYSSMFGFNLRELDVLSSFKIHTIRRDLKDRWKVGNDIHFVINNRTKDRFQFAPILKVKKIQTIEIQRGFAKSHLKIWIDNKSLSIEEMNELALNDGFKNLDHFLEWFSEDFKGKIIHWTDFSYWS